MFFYFLVVLILLMCLLSLMMKSLLFFWSLFLILTIIFIFLMKSESSFLNLFNYFILQEISGLLFLLLKNFSMQIAIVFLKVGVSPLHFWVFTVLVGLSMNLIFWFMTFQKLVYLLIMMNWGLNFIFLLFLGIFICFIQVLFLFDFLKILIVNLTESLSWILVFFVVSFYESMFLMFYYFSLMIILLKNNLKKKNLNWLMILFLLNLPLSFSFFIKIFILLNFSWVNFFLLLVLLFFMVVSVLGLMKILMDLSLNLKYNNFFTKV